jgi:hypothetical protein
LLGTIHATRRGRGCNGTHCANQLNYKMQNSSWCAHGVMTDGVVLQFHEFQWKVENRTTKILTHDLKEIADWLVFVLKSSLESCHRFTFKISIPLGEAAIMQIHRPDSECPRFFQGNNAGWAECSSQVL